jgi:hypothetical protein
VFPIFFRNEIQVKAMRPRYQGYFVFPDPVWFIWLFRKSFFRFRMPGDFF